MTENDEHAGKPMSDVELQELLCAKPTGSVFGAWLKMAKAGRLEGKGGFTQYAFADRLALLPHWFEGDARAFDLVNQAVKRWVETGVIPPKLDWRYWESYKVLPPFIVP